MSGPVRILDNKAIHDLWSITVLLVRDFAPGNWVGVELDTSQGKNDGSVEGKWYFSCEAKKGMFVKPKNLKLDKRGREMRVRKQQPWHAFDKHKHC